MKKVNVLCVLPICLVMGGCLQGFKNQAGFERRTAPLRIISAALNNDYMGVKSAVDSGISVNTQDGKGGTALMAAAITGDGKIVKYMLGKGADPSIKNIYGQTAFQMAYVRGYTSVCAILKQK